MKKLVCEMCGDNNLIKKDGVFVCQSCGTKYSVEDAKKMMVEVSGQVSIDDSGKLSTYIQMADSAYNVSNWQEAYTYYSKAQEIDVNNYHSIYRRGLSYGWQGSLMDFRAQEVIGGIINAKKAMTKSNDNSHKKAIEVSNMMLDMANWAGALAGASISGGLQSITSSPAAAQNFYERICIISELFVFSFEILDEQSYSNLTVTERNNFKNKAKEITGLTSTIATTMQSASSLRVNNGSKFNSFWLMYEDSYKRVKAPSSVSEERNKLISATNTFKNQLNIWDNNIVNREKEQKIREIKEKREKFFRDNPGIYKEYTNNLKKQKILEESKIVAEREVQSAEEELSSIIRKISDIENSIFTKNADITKLQKKKFGKKKAEEEILRKKTEIESLKNERSKLENPRNEAETKMSSAKQKFGNISKQFIEAETATNNILRQNGL